MLNCRSVQEQQLAESLASQSISVIRMHSVGESSTKKRWFRLVDALEKDLRQKNDQFYEANKIYKFRSSAVLLDIASRDKTTESMLLLCGLPDSPAKTGLLLRALRSNGIRFVFSITTAEIQKLVHLATHSTFAFQEIVIFQPPLAIGNMEEPTDPWWSCLILANDELSDSFVKLATSRPVGSDIADIVDEWRASAMLKLHDIDTLNAVLVPGVDHAEMRHFACSKFAHISMPKENSVLRLVRSRDRFGRAVFRDSLSDYEHTSRLPTVFPPVECNPLFYLALLTHGHFFNGFPITTLEAFDLMETSNSVRTGNINALMNDGNFLEAVTAVAFVAASHRGSVRGTLLPLFTLRLVHELLPRQEAELGWSKEAGFETLSLSLDSFLIPFLSPVNSRWPFSHSVISFGNLHRPSHAHMVDIIVENEGTYAEVKNYKDPLDSQTVLGIVSRLKVDAKVLFVVTNRLRVPGALSGWRARLSDDSSESDIQDLISRLNLSTPRRKLSSHRALLPDLVVRTTRFRDVNLVAVKRSVTNPNSLFLEALPGSDPVPNAQTLVIFIPIQDIASLSSSSSDKSTSH